MTDQQNEAPEVWLVTGGRLWEDRPFTSKQAAEQTVERRDDGSTVVRMVPATPLTTEGAEEGRSAALEALNRLHTVHFWNDLDATEESQVAKEEDIALIRAYLASPVMSPVGGQAFKTLTMIYDLLGIGAEARTPGTLKGNIETLAMFAEKLRAVEAEFFMVPGEPDEDDAYPDDVCLVNSWGASTEEYLNQFRSALKLIGVHPAHQVAVPEIVVVALKSARASLATYGEHPIIEGRIKKALQALSAPAGGPKTGMSTHRISDAHRYDSPENRRKRTDRSVGPGAKEECPECGSAALEWSCTQKAPADVPDGRLRVNEVETLFVLGCTECSETVLTMTAHDACWVLSNPTVMGLRKDKREAGHDLRTSSI